MMRNRKVRKIIQWGLIAVGIALTPVVRTQTPVELVKAAIERTHHQVTYDGRYLPIPYPNGDVPANIGVCTDVVIRSYRQLGIDLQQRVHEDMKVNFNRYPKTWGLKQTDRNIDHRRVPNLRVYFSRFGESFSPSKKSNDYRPGDIVTWMLPGNLPHIGIVTSQKSPDGRRFLVVHNIGRGPKMEDFLFGAPLTGHYRYFPEN